MKSFTALVALLVLGSSQASILSPYGYGYVGYAHAALPAALPAPLPALPEPEQAELKVETIEAPKGAEYTVAAPYAAGYAAPYAAGYAAPYAAGYATPYAAGYAAPYAAGYAAPYAAGYAAPYATAGYVAAPVAASIPVPELKVETIEAPKAVGYAVATPYAPAALPAPIPAAAVPAPYAAAPYAAPYAAAGYAAGYAAPYAPGYVAAPVAPASSQFHAQDEFGNLNFGYSNINSAKTEAGNAYGGVSGGYQYVDANGVLQTVSYVADGLGFRTVDSRLPVAPEVPETSPLVQAPAPVFEGTQIPDTPEVAEAKAEFQKTFDEAVAAAALWD